MCFLSSNMQIAKLNKFVDIWDMVEYLKNITKYYLLPIWYYNHVA